MKRSGFLIIALLLNLFLLKGQVVTSIPSFVTEADNCVITFDATQGDKGLSGFTGELWAHIGVITNLSTSNSDWKYVKSTWAVNIDATKLTYVSANKWTLTLSPNLRSYFGITDANETIQKIAMVIRNTDGSKTGRDVGGADIFLPVYTPGLNLTMNTPPSSISLVNISSTLTLKATASQPCTLKMYLNNTQIGTTQTNATTISVAQTFSTSGSFYIIAEASNGTTTVRDSSYICVRPSAVPTAPRPQGINDGINYVTDTKVTLSLFAKGHSYVYLLGDFNDWKPDNNYQLTKDGDYFWINVNGLTPGKEYGFQYFVDGTILCGDPYSEKILDPWNDKWINQNALVYPNLKPYPTGLTEGVVSVFQTAKTAFNWQVNSFTPPAFGNLSIYELHLRDFTPEGTVQAATAKLDYLQHLGINAIELMPINEFDGNDSWGYNPNFWMATDKAYGTSNDYKHFIDECHRRGIAVILDVVFNHSWGLSPMAKMWWDATNNRPSTANPYLFPIAMHPYNVGSDFNHSSIYTRNYFKTVIKYWLNEFKIDGYRFDLSKGFTPSTFYTTDVAVWGNFNQGRIDILCDYNRTVKATNPRAYLILEHFGADTEEKVLADSGMMVWGNMNYAFCQTAMAVQTGSDFTRLTAASRGWVAPRVVGYMESHDEERMAYKALTFGTSGISNDSLLRMKQLGANAAMFLLTPGPKMIWQFGELGYDVNIDFNGRTGKKPVRWDYFESIPRRALYETYSKLLSLRNQHPLMFSQPTAWDLKAGFVNWTAGRREYLSDGTLSAIVVANYTGATITCYPYFTKSGNWYDLMTGEALNVLDIAMPLSLEPGEFRVFTDQFVNELSTQTSEKNSILYPNPTVGKIGFKGPEVVLAEIFSLNGTKMLRLKFNNQEADVSTLPAGLYICRTHLKNGKTTIHKLTKL
ncbi:MAG TPA: alpha-amylase family glycosyl hydrolase [Bacteroidales bacterium]|nr:alpha-amylase family glycosyl hydrolase [Bacteroidales bacterium]